MTLPRSRSIDYSTFDFTFEVALLCRAQAVIEQQHLGLLGVDERFQLLDFACADKKAWMWPLATRPHDVTS